MLVKKYLIVLMVALLGCSLGAMKQTVVASKRPQEIVYGPSWLPNICVFFEYSKTHGIVEDVRGNVVRLMYKNKSQEQHDWHGQFYSFIGFSGIDFKNISLQENDLSQMLQKIYTNDKDKQNKIDNICSTVMLLNSEEKKGVALFIDSINCDFLNKKNEVGQSALTPLTEEEYKNVLTTTPIWIREKFGPSTKVMVIKEKSRLTQILSPIPKNFFVGGSISGLIHFAWDNLRKTQNVLLSDLFRSVIIGGVSYVSGQLISDCNKIRMNPPEEIEVACPLVTPLEKINEKVNRVKYNLHKSLCNIKDRFSSNVKELENSFLEQNIKCISEKKIMTFLIEEKNNFLLRSNNCE